MKKSDLDAWIDLFRTKKERYHIETHPVKETLFGIFYVLYPQIQFKTEEIDGFQVDPLEETIKFCQKKIYSYEPALEMLDEMYSLGLGVKYREVKTNFW